MIQEQTVSLRRVSLAASAVFAILAIAAPGAFAAYVITIAQNGSNIVASGSGSLDLTDSTNSGYVNWESFIGPSQAKVLVGSTTLEYLYYVSGSTTSFGTGGFKDADSSSGTAIAIAGSYNGLYVAASYVSGSITSGTATWNDTTLSGLGLLDGTYTWTLASDDTISVVVGGSISAVPEPASIALLGIPAAFTVFRRRRA